MVNLFGRKSRSSRCIWLIAALARFSWSRAKSQIVRRAPDHIELVCPMRFREPKVTLLSDCQLRNSSRWGMLGAPGGAREDRTPDLLHAMQALSQLSYG